MGDRRRSASAFRSGRGGLASSPELANGLTTFSPNAFADTPAVTNYHVTIPVSGFVIKPAGTYNLGVGCASVTGSAPAYSAAVTYTAVPVG
jgi:hypothetical protein